MAQPAATSDDSTIADVRRGRGRPPRVDRQMIAEAAHAVGLDDLTMRAVADHLGVSVPGLYHPVDGKDDLLRLAAEYTASRLELPHDRGQHWAVWLYEWGYYNRDAFMAEPELLKQFIEGALGADRTAPGIELALSILVRNGFSTPEAQLAYGTVSDYAVGAAVMGLRERRATEQGRPTIAEIHRVLAQVADDEYPHLRELVGSRSFTFGDAFDEGLVLVLRGVCESRRETWAPIAARLRRARQRS